MISTKQREKNTVKSHQRFALYYSMYVGNNLHKTTNSLLPHIVFIENREHRESLSCGCLCEVCKSLFSSTDTTWSACSRPGISGMLLMQTENSILQCLMKSMLWPFLGGRDMTLCSVRPLQYIPYQQQW